MPLEAIFILAVVGAYFAVFITALLLHGIWVAPFIERHGARAAGFTSHWIIGTGLIRDYITARRICKQKGLTPHWVRWFSVTLLAIGIMAAGIVGFILLTFAAT